jgi:hypothetical protein
MKLAKSTSVAKPVAFSKKERAGNIHDSIRHVLFYTWDPIGINDQAQIDDEYDSYIGPIYRMLVENRKEEELVQRLLQFERDAMGLPSRLPEEVRPVARKLLALDIHLDSKKTG